MKLYDFMNTEEFKDIQKRSNAVEFVDYFMTVKQDVLNQLDSINLQIGHLKLSIADSEANELLHTNFKEEYGKDNESIRKAHLQKVNESLLLTLSDRQFDKSVLDHQVDILNDLIKSNRMMLKTCNCGDE